MAFVKLARAEEVPPGQTRYFPLDNGPVLLANYAGTIYAVSGICLHKMNPLDGAALSGPYVDCPYHHFQYDARTGVNYFPQNVYAKDLPHLNAQLGSLKTFAVEIRDGEVWVDAGE